MPMTFKQLKTILSSKSNDILNAISNLNLKIEDFLSVYNTCETETEKQTLKEWIIKCTPTKKHNSDFFVEFLLSLVDLSRRQGDTSDAYRWILSLLEQNHNLRDAINGTRDRAAVKIDSQHQPAADGITSRARMMTWLLTTDPLFTYQIDRFPKTKKDFPSTNLPAETFLSLEDCFFYDRRIRLNKILTTPDKFWHIFDACFDDKEREQLITWAFDSLYSGNSRPLFSSLEFFKNSVLTDPNGYTGLLYAKRRRGALLLLEKLLEKFTTLRGFFAKELTYQNLPTKTQQEIVSKMSLLFDQETELFLEEKFPELLKHCYHLFLSGRRLSPEEIGHVQRLAEPDIGGLTRTQAKKAIDIRNALAIRFQNYAEHGDIFFDNALSFAATYSPEQPSNTAPDDFGYNLHAIFFSGQRNDFFAKLLREYPEVVKTLLERIMREPTAANFTKLVKLFAKPADFIRQYGGYATEESLYQSIFYVAQTTPDDLQSLLKTRLESQFDSRRRTIGETVNDYFIRLVWMAPLYHYQNALESFLTSPAIFERVPIHRGVIRSFLVIQIQNLRKEIPPSILKPLVCHPHFRDLFLAEESQPETQSRLDDELLIVTAKCIPFLFKAIADSRTRKLAIRQLISDQSLMHRIIGTPRENNDPEFESIRQAALTAMANDPACSEALLSVQPMHLRNHFLSWARENKAWFDRLFLSKDDAASACRIACTEFDRRKVFNTIESVDRSAFVYLAETDKDFLEHMLIHLDWIIKNAPQVLYSEVFCNTLQERGLLELGERKSPYWWCITQGAHPLNILMADHPIRGLDNDTFVFFKRFFTVTLSGATSLAQQTEHLKYVDIVTTHGEHWFQQEILGDFFRHALTHINEAQLISLLRCITIDDKNSDKLKLRKNILRAYLNAQNVSSINFVSSDDIDDKKFKEWLDATSLEIAEEMDHSVPVTPAAAPSPAKSTFYAPALAPLSSSSSTQDTEAGWRKDIAAKLEDSTTIVDPCVTSLLKSVLGKSVPTLSDELLAACYKGVDISKDLERKVGNSDPKFLSQVYYSLLELQSPMTSKKLNLKKADQLMIERLFKEFSARLDALQQQPAQLKK